MLVPLALAACGSTAATHSTVALRAAPGTNLAARASPVAGEASVGQQGDRITGSVWVGGLVPGSRHAVSIQGPLGGCAPIDQPANLAVLLHDLVANRRGVASLRFDAIAHEQVLAKGYDIAVYADPYPPINAVAKSDPMLLCGDIRSVQRGV